MASSRPFGGLASSRLAILSTMKLVLAGIANIPLIGAVPIRFLPATLLVADEGIPPKSPKLWIYLVVAMVLVLLGGAFAGLTIALMGQVTLINHQPAKEGSSHDLRTRFTCKSSRILEMDPSVSMPQRYFDCSREASIGSS